MQRNVEKTKHYWEYRKINPEAIISIKLTEDRFPNLFRLRTDFLTYSVSPVILRYLNFGPKGSGEESITSTEHPQRTETLPTLWQLYRGRDRQGKRGRCLSPCLPGILSPPKSFQLLEATPFYVTVMYLIFILSFLPCMVFWLLGFPRGNR